MRKKKHKEDLAIHKQKMNETNQTKSFFDIPFNSPQKMSLTPFVNPFENSQSNLQSNKNFQNESRRSDYILPTPPSFLREYKRCNGGTIDDFVNVNAIRQMVPESRQILNPKAFSNPSPSNVSQPEFSRLPRTPPNQRIIRGKSLKGIF